MNIWESRCIPIPDTFKLITPQKPQFSLVRMDDLFDNVNGRWREDMIDVIFLPVNADIIKSILLSIHRPPDRVVCHFLTSGELTVHSTYHLIRSQSRGCEAGSNVDGRKG